MLSPPVSTGALRIGMRVRRISGRWCSWTICLIRVVLMAEFTVKRVLCPRCGSGRVISRVMAGWRPLWFMCLECLNDFRAEEVS